VELLKTISGCLRRGDNQNIAELTRQAIDRRRNIA